MSKYNLINAIYIYIYIREWKWLISTSLQPSNSGKLMYFLFLNKCFLHYETFTFINGATYEG